jgi:hypothetical protein
LLIGKEEKLEFSNLNKRRGIIEGNGKLQEYITNYYKGSFAKSERNNFSMVESFNDDIPQITPNENEALVVGFSKKEVRDARPRWLPDRILSGLLESHYR